MVLGAGIEGTSVVMLCGAPSLRGKRFTAANDNERREPVKTVTVRRTLEKSGVAIKFKVPVTEYFGVAVATRIAEDGMLCSSIELVHSDPDFNYKVFEETGNSNVVAEWQNWGKKLRLPLYIRAGDGSLMPYSQQVDGVTLGETTGRRRLASEAMRRPRFLHQRKPGVQE